MKRNEALIKIGELVMYARTQGWDDVYTDAFKTLEQEPCEDAISRKSVINLLPRTKFKDEMGYRQAHSSIENLPSVTPTRKKGKWIAEYDSDGHFRTYHCSNCGNLQGYTSNFCEECGSENREVEE